MAKKVWMPKPKKKSSLKIPESTKSKVKSRADTSIKNVLKPKYI